MLNVVRNQPSFQFTAICLPDNLSHMKTKLLLLLSMCQQVEYQ